MDHGVSHLKDVDSSRNKNALLMPELHVTDLGLGSLMPDTGTGQHLAQILQDLLIRQACCYPMKVGRH